MLGLTGAAAISQALKEHTNERLAEIDLGYNEIKDEGACAVAQVCSLVWNSIVTTVLPKEWIVLD